LLSYLCVCRQCLRSNSDGIGHAATAGPLRPQLRVAALLTQVEQVRRAAITKHVAAAPAVVPARKEAETHAARAAPRPIIVARPV
jgi:hypothetical protein